MYNLNDIKAWNLVNVGLLYVHKQKNWIDIEKQTVSYDYANYEVKLQTRLTTLDLAQLNIKRSLKEDNR